MIGTTHATNTAITVARVSFSSRSLVDSTAPLSPPPCRGHTAATKLHKNTHVAPKSSVLRALLARTEDARVKATWNVCQEQQ